MQTECPLQHPRMTHAEGLLLIWVHHNCLCARAASCQGGSKQALDNTFKPHSCQITCCLYARCWPTSEPMQPSVRSLRLHHRIHCTRAHIHTHTHTHAHLHTRTRTRLRVCACVYVCACACVCMCVRVRACIRVHACVRVHTVRVQGVRMQRVLAHGTFCRGACACACRA